MSTEPFDAPDRLNEDGTVTYRIVPSNWRRFWMGPDTYHLFTTDNYEENEFEHWRETVYPDLEWGDLDWHYDHPAIRAALAEEITTWMHERLFDLGVESVKVELVSTWSPAYYNFQTDGMEVEVTLDPAELRGLTGDFDLDAWARDYYGSVDGFHSFVPSRMEEDDWHAEFDLSFRLEYLLAENNDEDWDWRMRIWENDYEIYMNHVYSTLAGTNLTAWDVTSMADALTYPQTEMLPIGETA